MAARCRAPKLRACDPVGKHPWVSNPHGSDKRRMGGRIVVEEMSELLFLNPKRSTGNGEEVLKSLRDGSEWRSKSGIFKKFGRI